MNKFDIYDRYIILIFCEHTLYLNTFILAEHLNTIYMGLNARKPVFGGLRTTQAQTSQHIRAVWSAPLLFAFWKIPYLTLLQVKFQFSS